MILLPIPVVLALIRRKALMPPLVATGFAFSLLAVQSLALKGDSSYFEMMQVIVLPTHHDLDGIVQTRQRGGGGQLQPSPDRRIHLEQRHVDAHNHVRHAGSLPRTGRRRQRGGAATARLRMMSRAGRDGAAHPTRGIDLGAIEFIHKEIVRQRDAGRAVLLVSAELAELLSLSDRIAVLYEGRIVFEALPRETDERELGLHMTGRRKAGA